MKDFDSFLFDSSDFLETMVQYISFDGACIFEYAEATDEKMKILHTNKTYNKIILGKSEKHMDDKPINMYEIMVPKSKELYDNLLNQAIVSGQNISEEFEFDDLQHTGKHIFLKVKMKMIAKKAKHYLFYCVFKDITERKMKEENEALMHNQLRTIVRDMNDGLSASLYDDSGIKRLVFANDRFYEQRGYTKKQYEKEVKHIIDNVYPDDRMMAMERDKQIIQTKEPGVVVYRIVKRDGTVGWVRNKGSITQIEGYDGSLLISITEDITEKHLEQEQQRNLLDNLPSGAALYEVKDGALQTLYVNKTLLKLVAKDYDQIKKSFMNTIMLEDRDAFLRMVKCVIETEYEQELKIHMLTGEEYYSTFLAKARTLKQSDGQVNVCITYNPIEETSVMLRQILPVALEKILATTQELFFVKDRNYSYVCASRKFANMMGYEDEHDIVGKTDYDLFEQEMADRYRFDDIKVVEQRISLANYTEHIPKMNEEFRFGNTSKYALLDPLGNVIGLYGVSRDVISIQEDNEELQMDEYEDRVRYDREWRLKESLMKDAIVYYQWNLTTELIEEYVTKIGNNMSIKRGILFNKEIGEKIIETICPEDVEKLKRATSLQVLKERFQKGNKNFSVVYRRRFSDEKYHWAKSNILLTERRNSKEVIASIYCHDIDKEWREQLSISSLLNEDTEFVFHIDSDSGIAYIAHMQENVDYAKVYDHFLFEEESVRACKCGVLKKDQEVFNTFHNIDKLKQRILKEGEIAISYGIKNSSGIHKKLETARFLDEQKTIIVLCCKDVTKLEREEKARKRTLQEAENKISIASKDKEEFLSQMSHDLKTPLNAVLAFSNQEMLAGASEDKLRDYLAKVNMSGEYLLGIINDVLDLSRIEQNEIVLHREPYYVGEFEKAVTNIIGELCQKKNIAFEVDINNALAEGLMLDRMRFNQIFVNLLSNAIKFTPAGGKVELIINRKKQIKENETVFSFIVRDNGIGMSKEFLPHAFERFRQEKRLSASEENTGTGLGLNIVQELVELMGGTIELQSEENKGTTVTVNIPFEAEEILGHDTGETKRNFSKLKGVRVLLVEDNAINTEIVRSFLEKYGCIVEHAEDGVVACEKFAASECGFFQIVLMDIRMPRMDGLTATRNIRQMEREDAKQVPIIATTADVFNENENIAIRAGITAHLPKPIDPMKLYNLCVKYI